VRETDIGPLHSGTVAGIGAGIRWAFDRHSMVSVSSAETLLAGEDFSTAGGHFSQEMLRGHRNDLPARRQCSCAPAQPAHEHVHLDRGSGHGQSFTRPVQAKSGKATIGR
jgi:hypothetical protein